MPVPADVWDEAYGDEDAWDEETEGSWADAESDGPEAIDDWDEDDADADADAFEGSPSFPRMRSSRATTSTTTSSSSPTPSCERDA